MHFHCFYLFISLIIYLWEILITNIGFIRDFFNWLVSVDLAYTGQY